jgi:hypothetical protein
MLIVEGYDCALRGREGVRDREGRASVEELESPL